MDAVRKISRAYAKLLKNGRRDPDFFEFVRRVERAAGAGEVGRSADFQSEPMRFGQEPCLYRPATDIAEISERERLLVFVYFLGLCGTNGPLPLDLTNFVFQRAHNACDLAPRRFLDIFNHRFIGLFYRAWKMNEQAAQADAPGGGLIAAVARALSGGPCTGTALPEFVDVSRSGIFGNAVKSRDGLELLLCGYFLRRMRVVPGVVSAADIPDECRCRLGRRGAAELGRSIQIGARFFSCTRKFIVETEPLDFSEARLFFPGMRAFEELVALVFSYLDRPSEFDVKILVRRETLPRARLSGESRLGLDARLSCGNGVRGGNAELLVRASRVSLDRLRRSRARRKDAAAEIFAKNI